MKTIQAILFKVCIYLMSTLSNAQVSETPQPPSTPNNTHTDVTTTISNSTSVSNSNDTYKFYSKHESSKKEGVLDILEDALDNIPLTRKGRVYIWKKVKQGETVFYCNLTNNTLKIVLDKDEASYNFRKKIKHLGDELKKYISSHREHRFENTSNSVSNAQIRVDRAKEELKRAIRNLEKVKRNTEN
ncbi:putative lipoprotein [Tenacibaculum sp. 190130A14a]|uniref:Lipoprotein n=1 Tax=Tenacibaculum polynesiense TaxID=3137857 RepID=A0ABP1F033_9FLAO